MALQFDGARVPMRILIVNYEYPPAGGGSATATGAIARELVQLGNRVVVLTGGGKHLPAQADEIGVVIRRVPGWRRTLDRSNLLQMFFFLITGLICAPAIVREHRPECTIVFFSLPCGPIALFLQRKFSLPYVVSLRGGDVPGNELSLGWIHRILTPIRRAVLRSSTAVVATSDGLGKLSQRADPFPARVIPNGVDTDFFVPAPSPSARPGQPLRILFVGRFHQQKNIPFLLERLAEFGTERIHLQLVGDGPERRSLEIFARKVGLERAITWHGWLPRAALRDVYQAADCLVNVSLYEGMSNAMLEAMACGLPVIASSVDGNTALIENDQTGLLFDLKATDGFTAALERLFRDRVFAAELGRNARAHVARNFSWRSVAAAYLALLQTT